MNLEFTAEGFDGFALMPCEQFEPPSAKARAKALAADLEANPPPPCAKLEPSRFRLSPRELAAIERNCARLAKFAPEADRTGAMFS